MYKEHRTRHMLWTTPPADSTGARFLVVVTGKLAESDEKTRLIVSGDQPVERFCKVAANITTIDTRYINLSVVRNGNLY